MISTSRILPQRGPLELFERDGKLYEVFGGHCSCYGLEDQWKPEETTTAALRYRLKEGSTYGIVNDARARAIIRGFLDAREPEYDGYQGA